MTPQSDPKSDAKPDAKADSDDDKEEKEAKDGPFAVKFMLAHHKRLLAAARKRTHQTAGEWLGEAIEEKVAREREAITDDRHEIIPPSNSSLTLIDRLPPLSVEEMQRALEIAYQIEANREPGKRLPKIVANIRRRLEVQTAVQ